eukprot:102888_1
MSLDNYGIDVLYYFPWNDQRFAKWATRQDDNLHYQLNSGSRFLDIRLEKRIGTVYAHHGLLGAKLTDMLADIKSYLDSPNNDKKDIIILSFSDFINITPVEDVFDMVENSLGLYMKRVNEYNILMDSISDLLAKNINVIPIFDGYTTNEFIQNSNILVGNETLSAIADNVISNVLVQLSNAWDTSYTTGAMNQIFYALDVTNTNALIQFSNLYDSYKEFNADFMLTLHDTIQSYKQRVYFGNIIITDFIQESTVTDQVIQLNYQYLSCRDDVLNFRNCAVMSDLPNTYQYWWDNVCDNHLCPRSCGNCNVLSGFPGDDDCSFDDCDSDMFISATGKNGECFHQNASEWQSELSFCLVPFPNENLCTPYCSDDYQCTSGYCHIKRGVCLNRLDGITSCQSGSPTSRAPTSPPVSLIKSPTMPTLNPIPHHEIISAYGDPLVNCTYQAQNDCQDETAESFKFCCSVYIWGSDEFYLNQQDLPLMIQLILILTVIGFAVDVLWLCLAGCVVIRFYDDIDLRLYLTFFFKFVSLYSCPLAW